jgi:ComF family protein
MYNSLKSSDIIKKDIDFITYAPRMKSSVKFYGYNQTKALAGLISKYADIPYMPVLKASKSHDTEQKSLSKARRRQNVKNKFKILGNIIESGKLKDKNVIIIDDVVTTGSTLSECARIMKNAGAKNIYALCAASVLS